MANYRCGQPFNNADLRAGESSQRSLSTWRDRSHDAHFEFGKVQVIQIIVKSAIVAFMVDEEAIRRKHDLLAAAMHDYFWHTGAELTARWTKAMLGLPPSILRELAGRLRALEDITNQTNRELK